MAVIFMLLRALSFVGLLNGCHVYASESTAFLPQEFCNFTQWLSFLCFRESIRISFNTIILCNQSLCEAGVKEPISESIPSNIQKTMTLVQAYSILYPG